MMKVRNPTPANFTWSIIPDTVIDSAVDGDGNDLIDEVAPTTTSSSIDFTFSAELDGAPTSVDGFTCELDGMGPIDCSSGSILFTGLSPGTHTFAVFAFTGDVEDPTPATFTWTIEEEDVIPPEVIIPPDDEPAAEDDEPAAEDDEPAAEDDEPAAEDDEPAAEDDEPAAEDDEPAAEDDEPAADDDEPAADDDEPAADDDNPPPNNNNQPPNNGGPPGGTTNPTIPNEADGTSHIRSYSVW